MLTIDSMAEVAYLRLRQGSVASTVEVAPGILVDMDENAVALGVEVLDLDLEIPYSLLTQKCHVCQDDPRKLDQIRPSVAKT